MHTCFHAHARRIDVHAFRAAIELLKIYAFLSGMAASMRFLFVEPA
jgi:hypothetical protein